MKEKLLYKGKKYDNMGMIEVGGENMKRSKGFTLIELLAVIVILAIIALIATPIILNIINDSREKSNQRSVEGLRKATETTIGEIMMDDDYTGSDIVCKNYNYMSEAEKEYMNTKEDETYCWDINNPEGTIKQVTYSGARVVAGTISFNKETGKVSIADAQVGSSSKTYTTEGSDSAIAVIASKLDPTDDSTMFRDDYGNIRYRGANPNNYVTFNDELWRIIGIVDGKVKLIRSTNIENYSWDDNNLNNWSTASLQQYLNGDYYNKILTKNMIDSSIWYLGGYSDNGINSTQIYKYERSKNVFENNPINWTGYIGLMYPSDYGYAADKTCLNNLGDYDQNDICSVSGNWLYLDKDEWLLTHCDFSNSLGWTINRAYLDYSGAEMHDSLSIRPVLNLKSDVKITGGTGTKDDPYILTQ